MPLVLSRRRFLQRAAAAGPAAAIATHATWASAAGKDGSAPAARFAVVGDAGTGDPIVSVLGQAIAAAGPYQALLLLGDNIYPDGDPSLVFKAVYGPFSPVLRSGADLVAVLGNHDVKGHHTDAMVTALGMPGRWYSRDYGPVLIVALDSNIVTSDAQRQWLDDTLAASSAPWKIVMFHHPPYSSGRHGSNLSIRKAWSPILERRGVQLVLNGHDHDYERTRSINGVTYVVSGGGARSHSVGRSGFTAANANAVHYVDLAVFDDHIELEARGISRSRLDAAVIPR